LRKSLALLATTGALVAAAALPAHAAPAAPSSFTDATGDVALVTGSASGVSAAALAAADIQSVSFTPQAKALQVTWTLPKVHATADVEGDGYAQSFIAIVGKPGKTAKSGKGVMFNATNMDDTVTVYKSGPDKPCKTAKVLRTDTTVTVTAPYRCLGGWAKTKKVKFGAQIMSANATGLYSDSVGDLKGF
jgi:hypothetical protein